MNAAPAVPEVAPHIGGDTPSEAGGRLQQIKLAIEIVAVAVGIVGGVMALVWKAR